jgi:hypothetical protein
MDKQTKNDKKYDLEENRKKYGLPNTLDAIENPEKYDKRPIGRFCPRCLSDRDPQETCGSCGWHRNYSKYW